MDWFWYMIAGVVVLAITALVTALYMWKLYKDFPESMKAKVVSVEKWPINEFKSGYKYHFQGRNKGRRMMTDYVTYKEKKFTTGEKITVRMSKDGQTCHSNFPLWPAATSAVCILLACVLALIYVSDTRQTIAEEDANSIFQESGRFIVTDAGTYMEGDTMGLVLVEGDTTYVSTGDYGLIFYMGDTHLGENNIPCAHLLTSTVSTDGTINDISASTIAKLEELGLTIDTTETVFADVVEAANGTVSEGTHVHEDGTVHTGDHAEDLATNETVEETIPDETHNESSQEEITSDAISSDTTESATESESN